MIFSTKQYEGVAIQCKHFDKAIHEELQLHGQNPQVFVRWKSKKPFRVGSGDTFSFLANPSTLFSQDSFPPKNFDTKTHMVVCFSSASPPRFLFIWHLWCLTKKQVTKSIISTVGAACGPGISALGLAFLGVLCFRWWDGWIAVLFCHRKGGKGAPKAVVVKRRSYHSIERFASPFFLISLASFFWRVCPTPELKKQWVWLHFLENKLHLFWYLYSDRVPCSR